MGRISMKKKWLWLSSVPGALMLMGSVMVQHSPLLAGGADDVLAAQSSPAYDLSDQIIVKYRNPSFVREEASNAEDAEAAITERVDALSTAAGVNLTHWRFMSGDGHVLKLPHRMTLAEIEVIAEKLSSDPEVEYAEPDVRRHPLFTPNDTQYADQWHYKAPPGEAGGANLPGAWDITQGSASIVVAVIDTGIRPHTDFASGRIVPGYDFINDSRDGNDGDGRDSDPADPGDWITSAESASGYFAGCNVTNSSWHGTHVAGTIGAATNNSSGVAGVNWTSKILPVRVLGKCGGWDSEIADGMRWAAGLSVVGVPANANPAKVLNMSLGGSGTCGPTYQNAINDIIATGATVVVAAGNSNVDVSGHTLSNCSGVISVAATNRAGGRASYSNFGSLVKIAAPGGDGATADRILSTLNTGTTIPLADSYAYYRGTSMATPHVAGLVSLMLSRNPTLSSTQVLSRLQTTARAFPTGTGSDCTTSICGAGIIDASAAVRNLIPVYGNFSGFGLYKWTDTAWSRINTTPTSAMTASSTNLYATFTGYAGPYKWNGTTWSRINSVTPTNMSASGTDLYASFTGFGVYKYNGTAWSRINSTVASKIAASSSKLFASFTGFGLYSWDGTAWTKINSVLPVDMVASGTDLYASFAGFGVYKWNGTAWTRINTVVAEKMAASSTDLYATFTGYAGVYKWTGTAWTRINTVAPINMAGSGTDLYGSFTGFGVYKWNGTAWTRINSVVATGMTGTR